MQSPEQNVNFKDRRSYYMTNFSLGTIGNLESVNDKLILLSLMSLTYIKMKEKNPNITALEILLNITKQKPDDSFFYQMLENLSFMVEDLCYNCKKADSCGLSSSKEIVEKIKEILNTWIPF